MRNMWLHACLLLLWLAQGSLLAGALPQEPKPEGDAPAAEQPAGRSGMTSCLIRGGTIYTGLKGEKLEGDLLIRDGKIESVGGTIAAEDPAIRVIDAAGLCVVPGFCDASSGWGLGDTGRSRSGPDGRALDGFDFFDRDEMEWALSQGVTALAVAPPSRPLLQGSVGVIKLNPGADPAQWIVKDDIALRAGIGVGGLGDTFGRLETAEALSKLFEDAKQYRKSWEEYDEALKEYVQSLSEGAQGGEGKAGAEEKTEDSGGKGEGGGEEHPDKQGGKARSAEEEPPKSEPPQGEDSKKGPEGDADKGKEKPEKPKRPKFDPSKERILQVLDGAMALHVEAHRASDILKALELKERFHVDLVLLGCTEGWRILDRIREAKVPVILEQPLRPAAHEQNVYLQHAPCLAAVLAGGEVPLAFASGRNPPAARFLRLMAAEACGAGLDESEALEALTSAPARLLGVSDRIGSLEKGKDGDVVLFRGDPLDSDSRVVQVLVNGRTVWPR